MSFHSPDIRKRVKEASKVFKQRLQNRPPCGHHKEGDETVDKVRMARLEQDFVEGRTMRDSRKCHRVVPTTGYFSVTPDNGALVVVACDREGKARGTPVRCTPDVYRSVKSMRGIFPVPVQGNVYHVTDQQWRTLREWLQKDITVGRAKAVRRVTQRVIEKAAAAIPEVKLEPLPQPPKRFKSFEALAEAFRNSR